MLAHMSTTVPRGSMCPHVLPQLLPIEQVPGDPRSMAPPEAGKLPPRRAALFLRLAVDLSNDLPVQLFRNWPPTRMITTYVEDAMTVLLMKGTLRYDRRILCPPGSGCSSGSEQLFAGAG